MPEIVETLRAQTKQAKQKADEEAIALEAERRHDDNSAKRKRAGRIGAFVKANTEPTVKALQREASRGPQRGQAEAESVWRIKEKEVQGRLVEPVEELMKYRALSAKVAQHFVELGLASEIINDRYRVTDPHPEGGTITTDTDYRIGVKISWAEPQPTAQ